MTTPTYSTEDGTVTGRTYSRLCQRLQQRGLHMDGEPVEVHDYYTGAWQGRVRYNTERHHWEKWWRTADHEGKFAPLPLPGEIITPAPDEPKPKEEERVGGRAYYYVAPPVGKKVCGRSINEVCRRLMARGLTEGEHELRDYRTDELTHRIRYNAEEDIWQKWVGESRSEAVSHRVRNVAVEARGMVVTVPECVIDGVTVPEHTAQALLPRHWVPVTEAKHIVTVRPARWEYIPRTRGLTPDGPPKVGQ